MLLFSTNLQNYAILCISVIKALINTLSIYFWNFRHFTKGKRLNVVIFYGIRDLKLSTLQFRAKINYLKDNAHVFEKKYASGVILRTAQPTVTNQRQCTDKSVSLVLR